MTGATLRVGTSRVGPSCNARARVSRATESASDVRGFWTAATFRPQPGGVDYLAQLDIRPTRRAPATLRARQAERGHQIRRAFLRVRRAYRCPWCSFIIVYSVLDSIFHRILR